MAPRRTPPCILLIAGSDSSGGAGIQADLRTAGAFGLHALSVVTAVTAQDRRGVTAIHPVPPTTLLAQLEGTRDLPVRAVKIGMLGRPAAVTTVAEYLSTLGASNIVLDPVLAASSGKALLTPTALRRLRATLLPLADLLTPNLPEAEILLGRSLPSARAIRAATYDLVALGARAVLLKGGHRRGKLVIDYLNDGNAIHEFAHERLPWKTRGTGCTLATAAASALAYGMAVVDAVDRAERFVQHALRAAAVVDASGQRLMSPLMPIGNVSR